MRVDYHVHTFVCGHAEGTAEDYILAAKENNLDMIAFTDHSPLWYLPENYHHQELAVPKERLERYLDHVRIAQEWYSPYPVAVGMEIDYIAGCETQIQETISEASPDFVLGSIHFAGPQLIYDADMLPKGTYNDFWKLYLSLAAEFAETGLVDSIAHIDVLKHIIPVPSEFDTFFRDTVRRIATAGVCVELNSSGFRYGYEDSSPSQKLLGICGEEGVVFTVGSDAHMPSDVGFGLNKAYASLSRAGYSEIAVYEGRIRRMVPII